MELIRAKIINIDSIACLKALGEETGFKVGDRLTFEMKNGEKVEALAVKQETDGMIFYFVDCLENEHRMNKENTTEGGWKGSELYKYLNSRAINLFPDDIRGAMIPFADGELLTIPGQKELFGRVIFGADEGEYPEEQWEPMKLRRNRIAFQGLNGDPEYWWLRDPVSGAYFASVDDVGGCNYDSASDADIGVRPAFGIRA